MSRTYKMTCLKIRNEPEEGTSIIGFIRDCRENAAFVRVIRENGSSADRFYFGKI